MFSLIIAGVIGLAVAGAIILLIVVVVISRRGDFVNPFSSRKSDWQPVRGVSVDAPNAIPSNRQFRSVEDQEQAMVDWLIAQASTQVGVNLIGDQMVQDRMLNAVRIAMKDLEEQESAQISLPFLTADESGPKHFEMTFTRKMRDQFH